ncbi:MULE transposase domain - like 1 [Theobroma cacao]|nr:MULE transposase domain - like 1 [Theobroma cacao]
MFRLCMSVLRDAKQMLYHMKKLNNMGVMAFSNENATLEDNIATLKGEPEPVGGVDVKYVQCDDSIYNNPIANENKIRSLVHCSMTVIRKEKKQGYLVRGDVMLPTVSIDATHLKGKFKGILFVVVCKDGNECIHLVTFGNGHVEDEDSWMWFLSKLRDAIGCPENTMFIS